jgi:hypothetical protein
VVRFYDRGGNFCKFNWPDFDPDIQQIGFTDAEEQQLVAFLVSLTDNRVRIQSAPFDHPELLVPDGQPTPVEASNPGAPVLQATDNLSTLGGLLNAVGKNGGMPLPHFLNLAPNFDPGVAEPEPDPCS